MKALELISTMLLVSGCNTKSPNALDAIKDLNQKIEQRIPAQGEDPNQKPLDLPVRLTSEELESNDGVYEIHQGTRVQVTPPRMAYPFIDGAAAECRRLSESEMQRKRDKPEVSITCAKWF